jgi:hypothetical protein
MRVTTVSHGRGASGPEEQLNPLDTTDTTGAVEWRRPEPKPLAFR